ncbi:D-glycerate dehydrogenase [Candidatus Uhrbacteria bacterium]|nr:D-glycerate dehydrogenase [Candidatus Uhrbacteria bacterium]
MKPLRVFLTRPVPDEGIRLLKKDPRISLSVYPHDRVISRIELLRSIKKADMVWTMLTDRVDDEFFVTGSQVKFVANYAIGFDNIDLASAKKHGVSVANAPAEEIAESVAEHTIALMFALARRIVESDMFTRAGKYHGWGPNLLLGTDLIGKTVGIIGAGRIGGMVARRLRDGFGLKILYHNPTRDRRFEKEHGALYRPLPRLLKESDFVTLHVPLLPSTRHLISTPELKMMKGAAFLINTARGPVVDELALTKALAKKEIAGAGLDVYECEPFIDCNPHDRLDLRRMKNVVLTPHTASASREARQAMSRESAKNILAFVHGKKIPHLVQ